MIRGECFQGRRAAMTTREQLKLLHRTTVWAPVAIPPALSAVFYSNSPLNHTFRVSMITLGSCAALTLWVWWFNSRCKCPRCHGGLTAMVQQLLFGSVPATCPHCGFDLDQPSDAHGRR